MYIETINSPCDIKNLSYDSLDILANEMRQALLNKISQKGGHLAPNLGVIEATIALHYVFNSPTDKIVFDVSHQCYPHKMLTGRMKAYIDPEYYSSVTGFTEISESEHDLFTVGHTSTSISLASGLAKARDLAGEKNNVIAFIGDGSLGGGEALEGLDYVASELNSNFIIVLNDNNISIAENRGGLYKNLKELRDSDGNCDKNFFEAWGLDYRFEKHGNDVRSVIRALEEIKDIDHPVLLHICTQKGHGYSYSELNPELTHCVNKPFDLSLGPDFTPFNYIEGVNERYDYIIREHLLRLMKSDPLVATIMASTMYCLSFTKDKREEAGEQFIDVGAVEEHAVALAAGMARNGGKPVLVTASTFFMRTYDQISQELCINMCPATMIVINASIYAVDDVTHTEIFDIPMMSNIPNLVYLAPTNKEEYLAMLDWSIEQNHYPVAIRQPRNGVYHAKGDVEKDYSLLNRYKIEIEGNRVAVIALGEMFQIGEKVIDMLSKEHDIDATLINPRYITGIDEKTLDNLVYKHELVVTLESCSLEGGFGEKIASYYGTCSSIRVLNRGLKKEFLDTVHTSAEQLLIRNRMTPELLTADIKMILDGDSLKR